MFNNIDDIIEKYENDEIIVYYQFQDEIKITKEDRKKYNNKVFFDWYKRPVNVSVNYDVQLVDFVKKNNLPTLFLLDVRNLLIRNYSWGQAVIFYNNNRKPCNPKIRQLLLQKRRGYIKEY